MSEIINFPNINQKLSPELEKEWEEIERQAAEEAEQIVAYIDDEPEDNPLIRNYRKNLYDQLLESLDNMIR